VVEEGDYQMLARDKQNEDFVVDDDHAGYADGSEDWDEHRYSDEYSDSETRATGKKNRGLKRNALNSYADPKWC
jgi:hypothetical protein